jgi:hypothetical protein
MSQNPHILVQYITANIRFLLSVLAEGTQNIFVWLADMQHV